MTSFPKAVSLGLHQFMNPNGRSTRSEYWWYVLFVIIVDLIICIIDVAISGSNSSAVGIVGRLLMLPFAISVLMATIRRLHDTDRSGWWACLLVVPIACFYIYYLCCLPSDPEENIYD